MSKTDHPLHGLSCGDEVMITTKEGDTYAGEIVDVPRANGTVKVEDGVLITDMDTPTTVRGTVTLPFECTSEDVDDVGELWRIEQRFPEDGEQHSPVVYAGNSVGGMSFDIKMGEITDIEVYDD